MKLLTRLLGPPARAADRALERALAKRKLEHICRDLGVAKSVAVLIVSRYFDEGRE